MCIKEDSRELVELLQSNDVQSERALNLLERIDQAQRDGEKLFEPPSDEELQEAERLLEQTQPLPLSASTFRFLDRLFRLGRDEEARHN